MALLAIIDGLKRRAYFAQMSVRVAPHTAENFDDERIAHGVENLVADLTLACSIPSLSINQPADNSPTFFRRR